jgi:hypothetical protein
MPQRECEELFFMSYVLLTQFPRVGGFVTSWVSAGHNAAQTHADAQTVHRMPNAE